MSTFSNITLEYFELNFSKIYSLCTEKVQQQMAEPFIEHQTLDK